MDPFLTATSFATIVSLIGQFRSERSTKRDADAKDFLGWLLAHNHREIKARLETNRRSLAGLEELLEQRQDDLLTQLRLLDEALARIASGLQPFSSLVQALKPEGLLSEQARNLLRQTDEAKASGFVLVETYDGPLLQFLDATGSIDLTEERFLKDDLATLVETCLLRLDLNDRKQRVYFLTRAGAELG